jgi:Trypsin-co-occurring domain 1
MSSLQHFIFVDGDTEYTALIDSPAPTDANTAEGNPRYVPKGASSTTKFVYSEPTRVELKKVHDTIRGYTEYALGAFKSLSIAEIEELNLKFKIKISAEGGIPMLASGKTEADFEIEVKCKFPKSKPEI